MTNRVPLVKEDAGQVGWDCIWKMKLPAAVGAFDLEMPAGADIILVETQAEAPTLWARFPAINAKNMVTRKFMFVGTGHSFPETAVHVASWQSPPSTLHLFEIMP